MTLHKYPRTPHLPWSPGATPDDERVVDVSFFVGREVVVTEKLDGECTTIYRREDGKGACHARSLDTAPHPSRGMVRAIAGHVGWQLKNWKVEGGRIIGENVYAKHSIHYTALPSYFMAFAVHFSSGLCSSWDQVVDLLTPFWFELNVVPVLYRGMWDEKAVRACYTGVSKFGGEQEGYVVRLADAFSLDLFPRCVAKYVRAGHVQTDEHWLSRPVVPNGLAITHKRAK